MPERVVRCTLLTVYAGYVFIIHDRVMVEVSSDGVNKYGQIRVFLRILSFNRRSVGAKYFDKHKS
ncbi:hypothetical protein [Anaplasma phagocytophilum]|uniref:hypothetical protein n=1 Tax=Anaplasma phagocytophilum TaxID=948 RepID=UPI00200CA69F|nr:hypothetical protein [Anaplasma phagocytophilum]UQD54549.1 hypothetical protein ESP60_04475 [Anaplasma phagocytophilum]